MSDELLIKFVEERVHGDGSATYTFDMTDDMHHLCGELGLKLLLYCGILNRSPEYVFELLGEEIDSMLARHKGNGDEVHSPD